METRTIKRLAEITDEGLFERIATAVLRLVPDYEGIAHTGINAEGKTRKSPVDGLRFAGEAGNRLILAHHTITAANALERKWLLDPATVKRRRNSKASPPAPGDVVKSLEIIREERAGAPGLSATLILATNQEPDEGVLRNVAAVGRAENVTIDIWTRSRIGGRLDTDPRGQVIRRKLLGIEEELLSRDLVATLSRASVTAFDAGDNPATRVPRRLDARLGLGLGPVTFLVAPSGSGKTVAVHKALGAHLAAGGAALVTAHTTIEQALTLEQAVMATLHQIQPALAPGQNPFALFSEEDPLLILVEDISRSAQPQRLIEKITGWAPKENSAARPPWRLLCPVWPHLLRSVRSQLNDRIEAMSLHPEPMSHAESTAAVMAYAKAAGVALNRDHAEAIATALGDDPLLIALNRDWSAPRAEDVVGRFVDDALARVEQESGQFAGELLSALLDLGKTLLMEGSFDPSWRNVLGWELTTETLEHIRAIARQAEILRIDGPSSDSRLRFRHDRVRDWLLAEAALAIETKGQLDDALLAEPALAEVIGAVLVRAGAPKALTVRVQAHGPLALFHALRLVPGDHPAAARLASAAAAWLRVPENLGPATATLRWQAMAALEGVVGDFMRELISLFPEQSPMGMIALLRNGDVRGGIALCVEFELHIVTAWTARPLEAVRPHWGAAMAAELSSLIDADEEQIEARRSALVAFAGVLGDPDLAPALKRLWERDAARDARLEIYLWAMARCATPDTAAQLLDPVCAIWGALPDTREDNMPSPRDNLAEYSVRFAFEQAAPVGALGYFIERAKQPDLAWQIEYMLHGIDHPCAVLFETERSAERLRSGGHSYTVNNRAREHWRRTHEGFGAPMSPSTRAPLLALWQDEDAEQELRKAAFDMWSTGRDAGDLAILRASANGALLADRVLRERLHRGDTRAVPALIERLDSEKGLHWWFYARYVWSAGMYEALDRALAREAAKPFPDGDSQYEIGSTLTRVLMRLPMPDAERLLLRYWDKFGRTMHFIQAALFVATPELLARADARIRANSDPAKLFTHFTMHFGIRMAEETSIAREAQISALAPYFDLLRPEDLYELGDVCDENGWYQLRRRLIDPDRDAARIESPASFRRILDETLQRGHIGFIDLELDRHRKADVPWRSLAATLEDWLLGQPSVRALELADRAIRHAGTRRDAEILAVWPGEDKAVLAATIADLEFALRRHNRRRD